MRIKSRGSLRQVTDSRFSFNRTGLKRKLVVRGYEKVVGSNGRLDIALSVVLIH